MNWAKNDYFCDSKLYGQADRVAYFQPVPSSPSATQAKTRLKSCRTSRMDAVRMSHKMCHNGQSVNRLFSQPLNSMT